MPNENPTSASHPRKKAGSSLWWAMSAPFRRLWRSSWRLEELFWQRLPELNLFPTPQQRRKSLKRSYRKIIGRWPWIFAVIVAIVLSLTATLALRWSVARLGLPMGQTTINLLLMFPVMIVCSLVVLRLLNRQIAKHLRQELLDCSIPVCLQCGYHLIGAPGPQCPECGRAFDAHVQQILKEGPTNQIIE